MGSCERECNISTEQWVMHLKIRQRIYEQNGKICHGFHHAPSLQHEYKYGDKGRRERAYSRSRLPARRLTYFKALLPLSSKASLAVCFVTLLTSLPSPLSSNTMWVLYARPSLCFIMYICMCVSLWRCSPWSTCVQHHQL